MVKVLYVAVVALSLLSVGQSVPVTSCETLTQPLDIKGRDELLGKWIYVGESSNMPGSGLLMKLLVQSVWVNITAGNASDTINIRQVQKMFGRCFALSTRMTLQNSTLNMVGPEFVEYTDVLLNTGCADCLVIQSNMTFGGTSVYDVSLLSRRPNMSAAEFEDFTRQAKCLNLPAPALLGEEKDLCPEDPLSADLPTIDLDSDDDISMSDIFGMLGNMLSRVGGLTKLLNFGKLSNPGTVNTASV